MNNHSNLVHAVTNGTTIVWILVFDLHIISTLPPVDDLITSLLNKVCLEYELV